MEMNYYLLENIQGEEGNADNEAKRRGGTFETVLVKTKTYTVAELKEVCKAINIPLSGLEIRLCSSSGFGTQGVF